jgi:hypothetical protein
MADVTGEARIAATNVPAGEPAWWSRIQWGPVVAGALAGFAAWLIMTTLGAAIGMTAGASMEIPATETEAEEAALGFGVGAIIWTLLTAIVTGLVAGAVISRTARADRSYMPALFGGLSWTMGVIVVLCLTAIGAAGAMGGVGAGAAAGVTGARPGLFGMDRDGRAGVEGRPAYREPGVSAPREREGARPLSPEERTQAREAAEKAATAASTAAWVLLGSQLVSLAATMLAAGWRRTTVRRAPTEIRMSPAPTA